MDKSKNNKLVFLLMGFSIILSFSMLAFNSCGNSSKTADKEATEQDEASFYASQPVESGLYDADYYDIAGPNARKGRFDGRIYFTLSPDLSAFYVFENGNRTKIKMFDALEKPFEKNDSGKFCALDTKNLPVSISTDSTMYVLDFIHSGDTVSITFNPKPRHTGTPVEIAEKIKAQREKK